LIVGIPSNDSFYPFFIVFPIGILRCEEISLLRPDLQIDGKTESGKGEANQNSQKDRSRNIPPTTAASSNWLLLFRQSVNPKRKDNK